MRTKFITLLTLTAIIFGCTAPEDLLTDVHDGESKTIKIALSSPESKPTMDSISEIAVYTFIKDVFVKSFTNVETNENGHINISVPKSSKLYFLTNTATPKSYEALREGETSLSEFLALSSDENAKHDASSAPNFFSGSCDLSENGVGSYNTKIELKYNVARLDIDITRDTLFKVNHIVLNDANAITTMFQNEQKAAYISQTYEQTFEPAITGSKKDIFRIYESTKPIKVIIYGTYNSLPTVVPIVIPTVERGLSYKIKITNVGATITGAFVIAPWGEGETIEGKPDIKNELRIDEDNTELVEGIEADYHTNRVTVSPKGGEFTIGFVSSAEAQLVSIEGQNPGVEIGEGSVESSPSGIITKYKVKIAEQGKGRLAYNVVLNLKNALMTGSYNQVVINVAQSPIQMATVRLGGKTWMAFNARTRDLEDQIYQMEGATVLEMYDNNWLTTIGGMYQWGRMFMYTPWYSYASKPGDQGYTKLEWEDDTHVPCPEGYRLPSKEELRALLPLNQPVPSEYDYNGEKIAIAKHTSTLPSVEIDGVTGTARYVTLTSTSTGQQLIIPLAGHKGDKSTDKSPGFGSNFSLWAGDRRDALGGWAWASLFSFDNERLDGEGRQHDMIEAESYAYVRCMKK